MAGCGLLPALRVLHDPHECNTIAHLCSRHTESLAPCFALAKDGDNHVY